MVTENIIGYSTKSGHSFLQGVDPSTETYLEEKFSIADQAVIRRSSIKQWMPLLYKKMETIPKSRLIGYHSTKHNESGDTW